MHVHSHAENPVEVLLDEHANAARTLPNPVTPAPTEPHVMVQHDMCINRPHKTWVRPPHRDPSIMAAVFSHYPWTSPMAWKIFHGKLVSPGFGWPGEHAICTNCNHLHKVHLCGALAECPNLRQFRLTAPLPIETLTPPERYDIIRGRMSAMHWGTASTHFNGDIKRYIKLILRFTLSLREWATSNDYRTTDRTYTPNKPAVFELTPKQTTTEQS